VGPHAACLVDLAADDLVANDHVGEADADAIEGEGRTRQRFTGEHRGVDRRQRGAVGECRLEDGGQRIRVAGAGRACPVEQHQAHEHEDRVDDLVDLREAGRKPVVLHEACYPPVHRQAELIGARCPRRRWRCRPCRWWPTRQASMRVDGVAFRSRRAGTRSTPGTSAPRVARRRDGLVGAPRH
jgi:hypothetical protein